MKKEKISDKCLLYRASNLPLGQLGEDLPQLKNLAFGICEFCVHARSFVSLSAQRRSFRALKEIYKSAVRATTITQSSCSHIQVNLCIKSFYKTRQTGVK